MEEQLGFAAFLEECRRVAVEEEGEGLESGDEGSGADLPREKLQPSVDHVRDGDHCLPVLATELEAAQSSQCVELSSMETLLQCLQVRHIINLFQSEYP